MMPGHACSGYAVTEQGHHPLTRSKAPVVLLMDSQCSLKRDIRAVVTPTFKCTSPKHAFVYTHRGTRSSQHQMQATACQRRAEARDMTSAHCAACAITIRPPPALSVT